MASTMTVSYLAKQGDSPEEFTCSEVHSFYGVPAAGIFSDSLDLVTLVNLPGILVKNRALSGSSLKILALAIHEGNFDLDNSLCPDRALHHYLECVLAVLGACIVCLLLQTQ